MIDKLFLTSETRDWVIQTCLEYSLDFWLVSLSCFVAMFASYTAFHLVTRVNAAPSGPARAAWLATGAVSMGGGIWSMHFIAMLAVSLPAAVSYDMALTGLSLVFAMVASGFAFYFVSRGTRTAIRLVGGGVLLGGGIGAMHYTGMAAMHMDATIRYDPLLFGASVLVAVSLSTVALRLLFQSVESSKGQTMGLKIVSGCVMGLSVAAMHYTAMSATYFLPTGARLTTGAHALDASIMAGIIAVAAIMITGLALIATFVDYRMESKNRQVEESEGFLAAVVDSTADGIIAIDQTGVVRMYNSAAERMFGYDCAEIIGKNVSILLLPQEREAHDEYIRKSDFLGNRMLGTRRTLMARRKDGTTMNVEISLSTMQRNECLMFIGICHDITERISTQEKQKRLQQELQNASKLEAIGQLASGIAHEINTPAQYIGDNLRFLEDAHSDLFEVLKTHQDLKEAARTGGGLEPALAAVETAEETADLDYLLAEIPTSTAQSLDGIKQVSHIVQAMKDFSHHSDKKKAPVDLNKTIVNTLTISRSNWKYVAEVETELDPELPPVTCIGAELKQVLLNLVVNAAHAIEARGEEATGRIAIASGLADGYAEIRVSDSGTGIPEAVRDRIFDPFFTTKEVGKGTGQGLSISHDIIVSKHQGRLFFETEEGEGTTFVVQLPLDHPSTEVQAAE